MSVSKVELDQFAQKHSWQNQMANSRGLDSFDNYSGPSYGDLVVVIGRNRDSDILEESNFEVALTMLGGESDDVKVERFGHWGCGWFELILINPKRHKLLELAYDIHNKMQDYPVLDDGDYSEREYKYQSDFARDAQDDLAEALSKHFHVKNTKKLKEIAFELNMACQSYYGNDSCINVYTMREPDERDLKQLKRCLKEIHHIHGDLKEFKQLMSALNNI